VVVFVFGFYTFLVHGKRGYAWLLAHAPLRTSYMTRLADAFEETGRGLLLGFGLTSLLQGAIAAVAYAVIGVPQPVMLGALTALSALLPMIGTGLVWIPVAFALLLTEQNGAAVAVLIMGVVVGSLDNLVRPVLARHGRLELPTFIVLVSMLGGVMTFGASGLLLGPLVFRLLVEALRMGRDARLAGNARV
jgi:predicted PurR-regulated permease PerM